MGLVDSASALGHESISLWGDFEVGSNVSWIVLLSVVGLNGDVVDTSDDSNETRFTEMGTPGVSNGPVFGSVLVDTVSNNGDIMNDIHISSLILKDTTGVVLEGVWNSDTTGNWTSLVDLLHHLLLAGNLTVLIDTIDLIGVWNKAWFTWHAVLTNGHSRARLTIVVTSSSVNGAGLISDLVRVHPLEGIISFATVATIISRAGDEDLRGDVDIWPSSLSSDLDSIGES